MLAHDYDFFLADTDAGKSIHFNLRYQIYCLRERFEDPNHYPNFLEQDEYDESSVHFIARCHRTGEWLGAMRLILGPMQNLPISKFSSIDTENFSHADCIRVAEASRLCTLFASPSRAKFAASATAGNNSHASAITLGLIRASRCYSLQHGIVDCFLLITDSFARLLRRLGMEIEPVGSPCQHRGWRRPYCHNFVTGYREMEHRLPELYESFCDPNAFAPFSEIDELDSVPLLAIA